MFRNGGFLGFLVIAGFMPAIADGPVPDDQAAMPAQKLSNSLYVIDCDGTNAGVLIGQTGLVVIDPGVKAERKDIFLAAIRTISEKPIQVVLNTHSDLDHSEGNESLAKLGAKIITHERTRYSNAHVEQTFTDRFRLDQDGLLVEMIHIPSHQCDDVLIFLPRENALFMGDTFTNTGHPTFYSGGIAGQRAVLKAALAFANDQTRVVPGHGFVGNAEGLRRYQRQTDQLFDYVQKLHAEEQSAETILADATYQRLMQAFNGENDPKFLERTGVRRFVPRVIASDLVKVQSVPGDQLARLVGIYQTEKGDVLEVVFEEKGVFLRQQGSFMAQLLPLSTTHFHIRATFDSTVAFELDQEGKVARRLTVTFAGKDHVAERREKRN